MELSRAWGERRVQASTSPNCALLLSMILCVSE
jgi:hypothetical protein